MLEPIDRKITKIRREPGRVCKGKKDERAFGEVLWENVDNSRCAGPNTLSSQATSRQHVQIYQSVPLRTFSELTRSRSEHRTGKRRTNIVYFTRNKRAVVSSKGGSRETTRSRLHRAETINTHITAAKRIMKTFPYSAQKNIVNQNFNPPQSPAQWHSQSLQERHPTA